MSSLLRLIVLGAKGFDLALQLAAKCSAIVATAPASARFRVRAVTIRNMQHKFKWARDTAWVALPFSGTPTVFYSGLSAL